MAGRITSACAAVSVMNCSHTTVNRSSRREALQHALLIGRDRGRVRVPDDQRRDRRIERRVGQRLADARHVERAHRARHAGAAARGAPRGATPTCPSGCTRARRRGGARSPRAPGCRRSCGRRSARRRGAGRRRPGGSATAGPARARARARGRRRPGRRSAAAWLSTGLVREPLEQLVVAEGVGAAPLLVGEARVEQRAHDAERERGVRARAAVAGARRRPAPCGCGRDRRRSSRAPRRRASRIKRHRCGAVESGFQPHTTIVRACTHSSGSTSGEAPLVAIVPATPALAQMVRTSVEPPSASNRRLAITSPCTRPWVPR